MPQNSWPNGLGGGPEQHGVAAPERLQVGAVGERHLDLHEHVAVGLRLGPRHVLEPEVARAVEDERPHGVEDDLERLDRLRKSCSPSSKRSSGSTVGSGSVELGQQLPPLPPCDAGVADREPMTVSSRR